MPAKPRRGQSREAALEDVVAFLSFPPEIREVIYTTDAIESLDSVIRRVIKSRGSFPDDEAATKLIYLATMDAKKEWAQSVYR